MGPEDRSVFSKRDDYIVEHLHAGIQARQSSTRHYEYRGTSMIRLSIRLLCHQAPLLFSCAMTAFLAIGVARADSPAEAKAPTKADQKLARGRELLASADELARL